MNDLPKVQALKALFPNIWRDTLLTIGALAAR